MEKPIFVNYQRKITVKNIIQTSEPDLFDDDENFGDEIFIWVLVFQVDGHKINAKSVIDIEGLRNNNLVSKKNLLKLNGEVQVKGWGRANSHRKYEIDGGFGEAGIDTIEEVNKSLIFEVIPIPINIEIILPSDYSSSFSIGSDWLPLQARQGLQNLSDFDFDLNDILNYDFSNGLCNVNALEIGQFITTIVTEYAGGLPATTQVAFFMWENDNDDDAIMEDVRQKFIDETSNVINEQIISLISFDNLSPEDDIDYTTIMLNLGVELSSTYVNKLDSYNFFNKFYKGLKAYTDPDDPIGCHTLNLSHYKIFEGQIREKKFGEPDLNGAENGLFGFHFMIEEEN